MSHLRGMETSSPKATRKQPQRHRPSPATSCPTEVGAHEIRIRNHAYSAEVKSVSVPASGNGRVVVMLGVCVPNASVIEKLETVVRQIVSDAVKGLGILRTASTVAVVPAIVLAAAVVCLRYVENFDNRDEVPSSQKHKGPRERQDDGNTTLERR